MQVKVAIYCRVSTQEQADNNTSLESQQEQLEAFAKSQNWTLFNVYVDGGYTGKNGDRPTLKRMMDDSKLGCFDKVIVWRLDRLARNLRLLLEIEAHLRELDKSIFSLKELVDTSTPIGRTVFQVLGLAAEWERESIAERTKTGRLQRYKEGKWASGTPPFGYIYDKATKELTIDENEANIVRKLYDLYASGESLGAIAELFNTQMVQPRGKNSKGWVASAVRQVLINPVYKGNLVVNRHSHICEINKIDMSKTIQIPVTAIVSSETWNIAQSRLSTNKFNKPTDGEFLLQGLIKCGTCGFSYRTERINKDRYYECRGRLKISHLDGTPRCSSRRFKAEWLENEVWTRIIDILNDPNKLEPMLKEAIEALTKKAEVLEQKIMPVERRLREITEQKAKLADKWVIENMDTDKYKSTQQALDKEEERLLSLRRESDPAQVAELEMTRSYLKFWQSQVDAFAWNTEDENFEDRVMVRTIDKPHKTVLTILGFGDKELSRMSEFPSTQREVLDKLQVRLTVFHDRIDVNAVFPIAPIGYQKCTITGLR